MKNEESIYVLQVQVIYMALPVAYYLHKGLLKLISEKLIISKLLALIYSKVFQIFRVVKHLVDRPI